MTGPGGKGGTLAAVSSDWSVNSLSTYCFFNDVEALLVDLKGGHLLDDLLQQDVLFIAVAFNRQLEPTETETGLERDTFSAPSSSQEGHMTLQTWIAQQERSQIRGCWRVFGAVEVI